MKNIKQIQDLQSQLEASKKENEELRKRLSIMNDNAIGLIKAANARANRAENSLNNIQIMLIQALEKTIGGNSD